MNNSKLFYFASIEDNFYRLFLENRKSRFACLICNQTNIKMWKKFYNIELFLQ